MGPLPRALLSSLISSASRRSIPLFYIRSAGFYSSVSIQLPALFPIVETHPDLTATQDLRLLAPWPELAAFARSKTAALDKLSDDDHGHVPYLLLLLHLLEQWRQMHGSYPATYKDKAAFRETVRAAARTGNPEGGEENFDEAAAAVIKALNPPAVPAGLRAIFAEPECAHPTSASANFWVVAHALAEFVQRTGMLPLPGPIPDMKARSADYIALQNVYRAKAQSDLAAVTVAVRKLEAELNRVPVDGAEIEAFCKGAAFVKLVKGGTIPLLAHRGASEDDLRRTDALLARELADESSLMPIFVCLDALDAAVEAGKSETTEELARSLEENVKAALDLLSPPDSVQFDASEALLATERVRQEVARAGACELHNIASLTGGMAAQEVLKTITKQYIPVDNTVVYDGITSRTATFRF